MTALAAGTLQNLHDVRFPDLTPQEFDIFLAECRERGISPFSRHVYPRRQWSHAAERNELHILLTIDGFRSCAIDSGEFRGSVGPHWCNSDWQWHEVWHPDEEFPTAAKFGVIRAGCAEPIFQTVRWEEFAQYDDAGELLTFWQRMPSYMLGLRAQATALRAAFPEKLGGIYLPEELAAEPGRLKKAPRVVTQVNNLDDALIELGYESPDERRRIVAEFESRWSLLAQNNPSEFAARVLRKVPPKRRIVPIAE